MCVLIQVSKSQYSTLVSLRGYHTPNQKLACFVLYIKNINTSLKTDTCIQKKKKKKKKT